MNNRETTIEELRRTGYKVAVEHSVLNLISKNKWEDFPTGDILKYATRITVTDPSGNTAEGRSVCHSKDIPNKKMGNRIALGRAMKNLRTGNLCEFIRNQPARERSSNSSTSDLGIANDSDSLSTQQLV